jgi:hypothetical protein
MHRRLAVPFDRARILPGTDPVCMSPYSFILSAVIYPVGERTMERNVGGYDRIARFILGPLLVILAAAGFAGYVTVASGLLGAAVLWAALLVGAVFLVTATTQKCPLNRVLGLDTFRGGREGPGDESDSAPRGDRPA